MGRIFQALGYISQGLGHRNMVGYKNFTGGVCQLLWWGRVGIIVGYGWYNATVGEYEGMYMGQKQNGESTTCCTFAIYYIV